MTSFTAITIIYNPNSTGNGLELAKELKAKLKSLNVQLPVELAATKRAGHAEELAYKLALASKRPLIISASGDGGYYEVINGLLKAQAEGAHPTAGLLPAGNANDHYHETHNGDLARDIIKAHTQQIDVLKIATKIKGKPFNRYAHSYIGFGLTPKIGHQLNQTQLNRFNEMWLVLKAIVHLKSTSLVVDGKKYYYYSLIFSNVSTMSKVLSISDEASNHDGKFEVSVVRQRSKLNLLLSLIWASVASMQGVWQADAFELKTVKPTLVQLDGEIYTIDRGSHVTITLDHKLLRCIV